VTSSEASEPTAAAPPALKPSGAIRVLWWCVMLLIVLVGPMIFFIVPVFLVSVAAAFVVAVDSVVDRHLTLEQRLIGLFLVVAVIPAALLGFLIADAIGDVGEAPTVTERVIALALTVVSVSLLLALKPRAWQILKKTEWKP
jgi:hypothetical protein